MADSELGELRRPPRVLEQRIERTARWRAQGLAGGSSDALFPTTGDAVSGAAGSEDGAASAGSQWTYDQFSITSSTTSPLTLTYVADTNSEVVSLNGVRLIPTVDYTLDGQTLTLLDLTNLRLGIGANTWTLMVSYVFTDTAPAPFEPTVFTSWVRNGDATLVGGTEVRLTQATSGQKGSIVCPDVIPSGWTQITVDVTLYVQPTIGGDGWEVILWDSTQNPTTRLDVAGQQYMGAQVMQTPSATNRQLFYSNDGTTTISNASTDSETLFGQYDYTFVWTKTGASTASVQFYRGGVLLKSSGSDIWVPSTIYVGVAAYTGLFVNEHTVRSANITVI